MILRAGKSCRGVDNKMAIEYRNCTYHAIEFPDEYTVFNPRGGAHRLNHLASGVKIHNHDRLDLVSKGQVSEYTGTSKQDCNSEHVVVQLQQANGTEVATHKSEKT